MAAEKITLMTNVPTLLEFKRDDVKFSSHPEYGDSYSHLVNAITQGVRTDGGSLRATPILHNKMVEAGAGKGGVVEVTKVEVPSPKGKPRTEWVVVLKRQGERGWAVKDWDGNAVNAVNPTTPGLDPKVAQILDVFDAEISQNFDTPVTTPAAFGPATPPPTLASLAALYAECLALAHEIVKVNLSGTDMDCSLERTKDVATTFFIEANRKGIKATATAVPTFAEIPTSSTPAAVLFPEEGGLADQEELPF